jgi:hypothetical protein
MSLIVAHILYVFPQDLQASIGIVEVTSIFVHNLTNTLFGILNNYSHNKL